MPWKCLVHKLPQMENTIGRTQQSCGLSKVKLSEVSFQKQVQITGLIFFFLDVQLFNNVVLVSGA